MKNADQLGKIGMKKTSFATIAILLSFISARAEIIEVTTSGVGVDPASSEKAALISAVKQAVGAFMDAETLIENEEILYERILTLSDGFVSEFRIVGSPRTRPDGLVETTIFAKVKKGDVGDALSSAGLTSALVDGPQLWAQSITKLQGAKDAYEALNEKLPKLYSQLINVEILNLDGTVVKSGAARPKTVENLTSETISCTWNSRVSMNLEWWFDEGAPFLEAAYRRLSSGELVKQVSVRVDEYGRRQSISDFAGNEWRNQILIETSSDRMRIGRELKFFAFTDETREALNKLTIGSIFIELLILDKNGEVLLRKEIEFPNDLVYENFSGFGSYNKGELPRQVYFFHRRTFAPEFRVDAGTGVDAFPFELTAEVTPEVLREANQIIARVPTP